MIWSSLFKRKIVRKPWLVNTCMRQIFQINVSLYFLKLNQSINVIFIILYIIFQFLECSLLLVYCMHTAVSSSFSHIRRIQIQHSILVRLKLCVVWWCYFMRKSIITFLDFNSQVTAKVSALTLGYHIGTTINYKLTNLTHVLPNVSSKLFST